MAGTEKGEPDVRAVARAGVMIAGRYRVDSPLGAGGMSSVFAGHDTMLDRPVALKLLRRAHATNRRGTERLLREAKVTARIVHAACVQVFDGGIDGELGAFLVMERLDGEDLGRLLHRRGPLSRTVALGLMDQICSIVHAVHEARVVHRDLKPGNVFVLRHAEGTVPSVKLLDFGIAHIDDEDQAHLTEPGDVLGTLLYMAPERWLDAGTPDVRTDVYALGVMLYEMLSGAPPFQSDTKAALRLAVLNDQPPRLDKVRPDVPVSLADAIARAMSKDRDERPADVSAFARAIGLTSSFAAPGGETTQIFGGTARYRVERCISRGADTEIYAAFDVERSRPVAIKRLAAPRGEASLRLKREFRIAADVRHRNLVRLEELWEAQGELLLSM